TLRSAIFLSRMSSMLPVPLNSSKITSSIREPVSTSAVATIVREPPSTVFRAAPKNRLGFSSAFESTPPERIFPEFLTATSCARRRDDQSALSLPNRRDEIDDTHAEIAVARLQLEATLRITRTKIVEGDARLRALRLIAVDRFDFEQREIALPLLGRAHLTAH